MKYLAIFITAVILMSSGLAKARTVKLELLWETESVLQTIESVLVDKSRGVMYTSNMNNGGGRGNAFMSKVGMDGKIIELRWVEGLNGPKGMGIVGGNLFVADGNELVKIDIASGTIVEKTLIEGNPGLNDVTVGADGSVYVSGYNSNVIYKVKDGVVESIFSGERGENFNGLFWEKDRILLLTSTSSQLKAIDWATSRVTILAENLGHGDGIVYIGDGDYITSDWRGRIFYVPAKGEPVTLLDTREEGFNAADIDFVMETNTLYVPTFSKNTLRAYKVVIE